MTSAKASAAVRGRAFNVRNGRQTTAGEAGTGERKSRIKDLGSSSRRKQTLNAEWLRNRPMAGAHRSALAEAKEEGSTLNGRGRSMFTSNFSLITNHQSPITSPARLAHTRIALPLD